MVNVFLEGQQHGLKHAKHRGENRLRREQVQKECGHRKWQRFIDESTPEERERYRQYRRDYIFLLRQTCRNEKWNMVADTKESVQTVR
ncbi:hypothetical protein FVEN_g13093 [Fusarium venenatum]|nr:hypothetical protein FVEN_g13093 [Fusarium venenatum]